MATILNLARRLEALERMRGTAKDAEILEWAEAVTDAELQRFIDLTANPELAERIPSHLLFEAGSYASADMSKAEFWLALRPVIECWRTEDKRTE